MQHLSQHVIERAKERGISLTQIHEILAAPDQILADETEGEGQRVYQSLIAFPEKGTYLVRVFVDETTNVVKTVYRTSQISKYFKS